MRNHELFSNYVFLNFLISQFSTTSARMAAMYPIWQFTQVVNICAIGLAVIFMQILA